MRQHFLIVYAQQPMVLCMAALAEESTYPSGMLSIVHVATGWLVDPSSHFKVFALESVLKMEWRILKYATFVSTAISFLSVQAVSGRLHEGSAFLRA